MKHDPEAIRRVYGRGFADGLRAARTPPEHQHMNQQKAERLESSLNGAARKVLDAVPIQELWTQHQITAEMKRKGTNPDPEIIQACLSTLRGHGLIREPKAGQYQRVPVRATLTTVNNVPAETTNGVLADIIKSGPLPTTDPMDRLAQIADQVRALGEQAHALARSVEDIALDIEAKIQAVQADTVKLRQLKDLLGSI